MNILGRSDRVDMPEIGLYDIHAKIDTGAFSCCLHCQKAEIVEGRLEFILLDEEHPEFTGMRFVFDRFEKKNIRNSFGEVELRFVITTTIRIFDEDITAEFSLSNRGSLKFPILIGRKILRDRYVIDVTKKNLSYKEKRRQLREARRRK
jgi:hypothetical protein